MGLVYTHQTADKNTNTNAGAFSERNQDNHAQYTCWNEKDGQKKTQSSQHIWVQSILGEAVSGTPENTNINSNHGDRDDDCISERDNNARDLSHAGEEREYRENLNCCSHSHVNIRANSKHNCKSVATESASQTDGTYRSGSHCTAPSDRVIEPRLIGEQAPPQPPPPPPAPAQLHPSSSGEQCLTCSWHASPPQMQSVISYSNDRNNNYNDHHHQQQRNKFQTNNQHPVPIPQREPCRPLPAPCINKHGLSTCYRDQQQQKQEHHDVSYTHKRQSVQIPERTTSQPVSSPRVSRYRLSTCCHDQQLNQQEQRQKQQENHDVSRTNKRKSLQIPERNSCRPHFSPCVSKHRISTCQYEHQQKEEDQRNSIHVNRQQLIQNPERKTCRHHSSLDENKQEGTNINQCANNQDELQKRFVTWYPVQLSSVQQLVPKACPFCGNSKPKNGERSRRRIAAKCPAQPPPTIIDHSSSHGGMPSQDDDIDGSYDIDDDEDDEESVDDNSDYTNHVTKTPYSYNCKPRPRKICCCEDQSSPAKRVRFGNSHLQNVGVQTNVSVNEHNITNNSPPRMNRSRKTHYSTVARNDGNGIANTSISHAITDEHLARLLGSKPTQHLAMCTNNNAASTSRGSACGNRKKNPGCKPSKNMALVGLSTSGNLFSWPMCSCVQELIKKSEKIGIHLGDQTPNR